MIPAPRTNPDCEYQIGDTRCRVITRSGALDFAGSTLKDVIPSDAASITVVTDSRVGPLHAARTLKAFELAGYRTSSITVPEGEASKSFAVAQRILEELRDHKSDRNAVIVALGGGMISDLAGFVSAVWMRGVSSAICPTTLEAAIDACLGGKNALNLPGGKNLVGTFHQPSAIIIDPTCFSTLPKRDIRAGLAESVKHALLSSESMLQWHEDHVDQICNLHSDTINRLVTDNLAIKAAIVARDPHERTGHRASLNLGHTIGHAIEAAMDFSLRHGECVSIGLVGACRLSERLGLIDPGLARRVRTILERFDLPVCMPAGVDMGSALMTIMQRDKKSQGGQMRFVLLEGIGKPVLRGVEAGMVAEVVTELQHN